jgi:TRAP-type uncharacterized transport system fused permease subunit
MADDDKSLDALDEEQRKQIKELAEKEAKAERQPPGLWQWVVSLLGAALVLIYFYGAGFQALPTEYHLGVYVLITFMLVFLLYPAGSRTALGVMSAFAGLLVSVLASSYLVFDSPFALWDQLTYFRETGLSNRTSACCGCR